MSELINRNDNRATIRWKLLTGASALALTGYLAATSAARAEDSAPPVLWIELGGQFQQLSHPDELWVPANLPPPIDHPVGGVADQSPRIGFDADGKLTFQPDGSDWMFSAAMQFGKAKRGPKKAHDQTYVTAYNGLKYAPTTYAFTDMHAYEETKHLVLDFTAGKDVGLGMFSGHASSTVNFGVRYAQFRDKAAGFMSAQRYVPSKYAGIYYRGKIPTAYVHTRRSFEGLGPTVSWSGSVPIAGSLQDGLALDWGANAAVLFGRQRTKSHVHNQTKGFVGIQYYNTPGGQTDARLISTVTKSFDKTYSRDKEVTVPNLGGFAGLSYRLDGRAKVAIGYRADFFFGAIDGGIGAHKDENRSFYGPFASISIGIGD